MAFDSPDAAREILETRATAPEPVLDSLPHPAALGYEKGSSIDLTPFLWQDYRLRKYRPLKLRSDCGHKHEDSVQHTICVKVIDTFGCDPSILTEVPDAREGMKQ
jgi:hypothetical protein